MILSWVMWRGAERCSCEVQHVLQSKGAAKWYTLFKSKPKMGIYAKYKQPNEPLYDIV